MGHGRKKDQGSFHRRHKSNTSSSSSNVATGTKPDDPFYELQVVDEHLVWITWDELLIVSVLLFGLIFSYVSFNYQELEDSIAVLEHSALTTSRVTSATSRTPASSSFHNHDDDPEVILTDQGGSPWSCPPDPENEASDQPPNISFDDFTEIRPHVCSDGTSYGYDTYEELEEIMNEINSYSHDRYIAFDQFYEITAETFDGTFDDPNLYFDEEIFVPLCPSSVLRRRRKGPALYVNAENVLVECENCIMEVKSGSHMIFGPFAQDVMIRGIHFKGATDTSVRFPYDGAEVYFEDCYFSENGSRGKHIGTVADVNSTSSVDFLRCLMEKDADVVATSSLSIRTKGDET